ncbi:hypothetical protein NE237_022681 [Protea cynaroides]|uniref:Uncharacterized protein n=1 Tax=Protea cynaroides TaxID=273540 RepID=A0A9Q0HEV2_9MAGN|nr:hypothetical protein NE237_022681 [Protea cynaroides]
MRFVDSREKFKVKHQVLMAKEEFRLIWPTIDRNGRLPRKYRGEEHNNQEAGERCKDSLRFRWEGFQAFREKCHYKISIHDRIGSQTNAEAANDAQRRVDFARQKRDEAQVRVDVAHQERAVIP